MKIILFLFFTSYSRQQSYSSTGDNSHSENSNPMQFNKTTICQVMILNLYTVYTKHDNDKNSLSGHRKIVNIVASARIILLLTVHIEERRIL